ncbi:MAG: tetratricopeptide repeat protein [Phycisphaerales bacterium]
MRAPRRPQRGPTRVRRRGGGFRGALDDPSIHGESGALWYNLGNARLQAGDLGEAIAAYLEAQRLVPSDPRLAANLSAARARCQDRLPADRGRGSWSSAMAARNAISPATRLWAAIAAQALFWTLLAVRRVRLVPLAAIIAAGVATLLLGATVAVDMMVSRDRTQAVLVVDDAILRKGNGEGFDPAITARLGSGVELRVLEERPGWLRVRLPEGSEGWLRSEQVDRVDGVP